MEGKVNDAETGSGREEKRSVLSDKDRLQICFAVLLLITVLLCFSMIFVAF